MPEPLYHYTIYWRPSDFRESAVVRRWRILPGEAEPDCGVWCLAETVDLARLSIPEGMYCLPRAPEDDPAIVETWI